MTLDQRKQARYIDYYSHLSLADFYRWQAGEDVDTISTRAYQA